MTDAPGTTDAGGTERRLRAALSDRAHRIQPSPGGLERIEEKLMAQNPSTKRPWIYGGVAVAAVALLAVVGLVVLDDDDDAAVTADETSTTTESTTTTSTTTSSTTSTSEAPFPPDVDPYGVAYPSPTTSQRFESPEPAAQSYATEVLGFTELVVGEFRAGDSRSGEVAITDRAGGPETTVLVRQMDDDTWFVLASSTENIVVDAPAAGDEIGAAFETTGSALAFEGTVDVFVRAQDDPAVLGEGVVTGSGTPPPGPFEGTIELSVRPDEETPGIVVYRELSAEDGHVRQATSFPVRLLPAA